MIPRERWNAYSQASRVAVDSEMERSQTSQPQFIAHIMASAVFPL